MVIHNICMQHKDDTVRYGIDKEVVEFMEKFQQQMCPSCRSKKQFTCPHRHQAGVAAQGGSASELRAKLAQALWDARQQRHSAQDLRASGFE